MSCNICIPEPFISIIAIQLTSIVALLLLLFIEWFLKDEVKGE